MPTIHGLPDKYWQNPSLGIQDVVVIHVCDENRQINKDFCCRRDILVNHMKYFETFLAENENGYDDIDISVHCDVEIFEWLMAYIHQPDSPPTLEKSIVVSILISSEFLQMESLVNLCIEKIASCLSDIIKLPIDLSCMSEKLINRLTLLTQPKVLCQTKDRKDKILNKLYKRRVEIDFSRKNLPRTGGNRTIAASLTCCQYCGIVYLDNYVSSLVCTKSKPAIDFRGKLLRRHQAIKGWSLTGYLKTLHAGGMSWESIYWHVWAACIVFQGDESNTVTISALDCNRYTLESDGIVIKPRVNTENNIIDDILLSQSKHNTILFSLDVEDDISNTIPYKLNITSNTIYDTISNSELSNITSSLNPLRPPSILTIEIFELLTLNNKIISGGNYKELIANIAKSQTISTVTNSDNTQTSTSLSSSSILQVDFYDLLWSDYEKNTTSDNMKSTNVNTEEEPSRGRSYSPIVKENYSRKSNGTNSSNKSKNIDINDNNNNLQESTPPLDSHRRSNSLGTSRRTRDQSTSRKTKSSKQKDNKNIEKNNIPNNKNNEINKNIQAVFKAYPPEMLSILKDMKGPYFGVWTTSHPLELLPNTYYDALQNIQDMDLSQQKRIEWELDLLRDYNKKRLDRFESFLISYRDNSIDMKRRSFSDKLKLPNKKKDDEKNGKIEPYYKDKGRQSKI